MPLVLGLDAAWTANGSSGVALVDTDHERPRVVAMAPGYRAFAGLRRGEAVDWRAKPAGGEPPLDDILAAAEELAEKPVDLTVVDMPLARAPISGRRHADNASSARFGGRGCGTRTPSPERPGHISERLRDAACRLGYPRVTAAGKPTGKALLETYPHPAVLRLTGAAYRVPYKVARVRRYWPDLTPAERRMKVATEWQLVRDHRDSLLDGAADAYGDAAAAIWIPHPPAGP